MKSIFEIIFCVFLLNLFLSAVYAQEKRWTGQAGDGKYENPANWEGGEVPGEGDHVVIPENTPVCVLPDALIKAESFTIFGEAEIGKTSIETHNFTNTGYLHGNTPLFSIMPLKNELGSNLTIHTGDFISLPNATVYLGSPESIAGSTTRITTMGTNFQTQNLFMSADEISNSGSVWASNLLKIDAFNKLTNLPSSYLGNNNMGTYGGKVEINTAHFENSGTVKSGSSAATSGAEILIFADEFINTLNGKIEQTNNASAGLVKVDAKTIIDEGGMGSDFHPPQRANDSLTTLPGDVELSAVSIILRGEYMTVWAKNLTIRAKDITIKDNINPYCIEAEGDLNFYTTQDGALDLSGVHIEESIFAESYKIYSDNVVAPVVGLNTIFGGEPEIYPTDLNYTDVDLGKTQLTYPTPGSDEFKIFVRNTSMSEKLFEYNLISKLNWFEPLNGTTNLILPFEVDSFFVQFNIPDNVTESTTDTITIEISVDDEIIATIENYITCLGIHVVGIDAEYSTLPQGFCLYQNYPNPFNPTTTIKYAVPTVETGHAPSLQHVMLKIYNTLGQEIATLVDKELKPGYYTTVFNASGLASGVYFYRIEMKDFSDVKKMLMVK